MFLLYAHVQYLCCLNLVFSKLNITSELSHSDTKWSQALAKVSDHLCSKCFHWSYIDNLEKESEH